MILQPTPVDDEVLEELKSLNEIILFHSKVKEAGRDVEHHRPKEIYGHLNKDYINKAWDNQDYDLLRKEFAKAWVIYYTELFGDESFYTEEELIRMSQN